MLNVLVRRVKDTLCAKHGGGYRCQMECCTSIFDMIPTLGHRMEPPWKIQGKKRVWMCVFACRVMVASAETQSEKEKLMRYFKFQTDML